MSISILPYLDESAVASLREKAELRANELYNQNMANATPDGSDFATILREQTEEAFSSAASASADLASRMESYFDEAANRFNVSKDLLKAIAKTESNFNPSAVSHAGAVGVMQLMPQTAAGLGVTNSYDARENILGGAKYISSLLEKYNGDVALSLAAYNAGSGNVAKYGGIPPFEETQNYVKKVFANLGQEFNLSDYTNSAEKNTNSPSSIFDLTGEAREQANKMLEEFFTSKNISKDALDAMVAILKILKMSNSEET